MPTGRRTTDTIATAATVNSASTPLSHHWTSLAEKHRFPAVQSMPLNSMRLATMPAGKHSRATQLARPKNHPETRRLTSCTIQITTNRPGRIQLTAVVPLSPMSASG